MSGVYDQLAGNVIVDPTNPYTIGTIAATIRKVEGGNSYTAQSPVATASGAYQFTDGTWKGLAKITPGAEMYANGHAKDAPPAVQDAVAFKYIRDILATSGNNLAAVPVHWYYPKSLDPSVGFDVTPNPGLSVRKYVTQIWIPQFHKQAPGSQLGVVPSVVLGPLGGVLASNVLSADIVDPSVVLGPIGGALLSNPLSAAKTTLDFVRALTDPKILVRVLKVVTGAGAVFLGINLLAKHALPASVVRAATVGA